MIIPQETLRMLRDATLVAYRAELRAEVADLRGVHGGPALTPCAYCEALDQVLALIDGGNNE